MYNLQLPKTTTKKMKGMLRPILCIDINANSTRNEKLYKPYLKRIFLIYYSFY